MSVNKKSMIEKIADNLARSKRESEHIVDTLVEIMKRTLENEEKILISGFGKFSVKRKKERLGRNPATGDDMILEQRKVVTFKHSVMLKEKMNM